MVIIHCCICLFFFIYLFFHRTGEGSKDFRKIEELKVISLEETVHLTQEDEVLPQREEHVPTSYGSHQVMCEEDIVGQRASIVYEEK